MDPTPVSGTHDPGEDSPSVGPIQPADADSWLDSLEAPSSASAGPGSGGPAQATPAAEQRLGRYQVLETIGKGGYGRVYKAWDPQLEREVAIKVLLRTDPNAYRRFAREIKLTARLRHPNIVAVYDSGAAHGLPYLVMDYVRGRSLWELGKNLQELPALEAARILRDVAAAIAHAHAQGVLHRDIKPANVLVGPEGEAYVVDFGLARTEEMDRLTQTGAVLGTPLFMPLEQAQARQGADALCDVYALGATLYYALTGRPPHVGESLKELMGAMAGLPDPPSALNPVVPPALDAVCLRALQPDRARRTSSAADFAAELDAVLRGAPARPAVGGAAGWARRLGASARGRAGQGVGLLRRAVKGHEKQLLTGGYALLVTILCASMLLRGRGAAVAPGSDGPAPAATAAALVDGGSRAPAESPTVDLAARAARALVQARERGGPDLERQVRALEAGGQELLAAAREALRATVRASEPTPEPAVMGLLGVLEARGGVEGLLAARPLLDRALVHGPERVELLFWRGAASASQGEPSLAERDWVLARERDHDRLQDLRLAHQARLPAKVRELLLECCALPPDGLPALRTGVVPPAARTRALVLAGQLPAVAKDDLVSALERAAEGRRWSDVALGLKRLELWAKDSPLVALERARLLVGRAHVAEARQALVRAADLGAPAAALDRLGAELLWREGRRGDAAIACQGLTRRDPGPEGRAAGALGHLLHARPVEALAEADQGLAQEPEHVPCLLMRSLALSACEEPWSAMGAARRAHDLIGLADELVAAAWARAQLVAVVLSGAEISQNQASTIVLGLDGLLNRAESAFPHLLLARTAVGEPSLAELAGQWLAGAQLREPRRAEIPLLRGALAIGAGEPRPAVDAAWEEARKLDPAARITPAWAAAYRKKHGQEPPLPVEAE